MIVSQLVPKQGICSLLVESPDDLWTLRRLIGPGDIVVSKSSRVVKKEDEYSRPDRGERVKVTIALQVQDLSLDSAVGRLRIRGKIVEASDESVSTAGSHSINVSPGYGLTLKKERWTQVDTAILSSAEEKGGRFLVAAVDRREAGIGLLAGSHLTILSGLDSGAVGKGVKESDTEPFLRKIVAVLRGAWREGDRVVVAGPGHTKMSLASKIEAEPDIGQNLALLEGLDVAGTDGVRALLKLDAFQKIAKESVLVQVQAVVNELVRRVARGDTRIAYTLPRVKEAAEAGAVESCAVSDDVFAHNTDEEEVVRVLNQIEGRGGVIYLCDSSLEAGKQVSSFGGIVALLRYSLKSWR